MFQTTATTWGELKAILETENLSFDGMSVKAIVGESEHHSLSRDADSLPSVDFTILVTPVEHKGNSEVGIDKVHTKLVRAKEAVSKALNEITEIQTIIEFLQQEMFEDSDIVKEARRLAKKYQD
jgi:hypothetical protein